MADELSLHNDGPDIHAYVEDNDDVQTDLGAAALAEMFRVKDIPEAKATDAGEKRG